MHLIGSHISIAGGFDKCIDRTVERGGNCLMTFASSPRSLATKEFTSSDIESYLQKKKDFKIGPHFFHGVYLVNLATSKLDYLQASVDSLVFYQQLAGKIGGAGTIFHLGSTKEFSSIKNQIVSALKQVLVKTPDGVKLFLENAAGQGGAVGQTLDELAELISAVDNKKLGVCLDTQHLFASGVNLDTALSKFDQVVGLQHLSVVHLNDSKTDFDSRVDRHANLGEGKIGEGILKKFINDPRLKDIPLILEVPGDGDGPRREDIDKLKSLIVQ